MELKTFDEAESGPEGPHPLYFPSFYFLLAFLQPLFLILSCMILSPKHTLRISQGPSSLISPFFSSFVPAGFYIYFRLTLYSHCLQIFIIFGSRNLWRINCIWTEFCEIISFFLLTRYMDWLSIHCIVFQMDLYCWYRNTPTSSILPFFFNDFYLPSNWSVSPVTSPAHVFGC